MPIAPVRRISKTRKRKRRTHYKIEVPGMVICPNCGEKKLSHTICRECGYYDGKQVLTFKAKEEDKEEKVEAKTEKKAKAKKTVEPAAPVEETTAPVKKARTKKAVAAEEEKAE